MPNAVMLNSGKPAQRTPTPEFTVAAGEPDMGGRVGLVPPRGTATEHSCGAGDGEPSASGGGGGARRRLSRRMMRLCRGFNAVLHGLARARVASARAVGDAKTWGAGGRPPAPWISSHKVIQWNTILLDLLQSLDA